MTRPVKLNEPCWTHRLPQQERMLESKLPRVQVPACTQRKCQTACSKNSVVGPGRGNWPRTTDLANVPTPQTRVTCRWARDSVAQCVSLCYWVTSVSLLTWKGPVQPISSYTNGRTRVHSSFSEYLSDFLQAYANLSTLLIIFLQ